jgi:hypothetical protein
MRHCTCRTHHFQGSVTPWVSSRIGAPASGNPSAPPLVTLFATLLWQLRMIDGHLVDSEKCLVGSDELMDCASTRRRGTIIRRDSQAVLALDSRHHRAVFVPSLGDSWTTGRLDLGMDGRQEWRSDLSTPPCPPTLPHHPAIGFRSALPMASRSASSMACPVDPDGRYGVWEHRRFTIRRGIFCTPRCV